MNIVTQTPVVQVPRASVAFLLGASDAEAHAAFCPEMYFTNIDDKRNYARGFELINGATVITSQFSGSVVLSKVAA